MSKKLIKKCQSGDIIVKSDNTKVSSPIIKEKPIYIQPQSKQTYVSADYRSPWQQQQDQKKAEIAYNMYIDEKNKELALQHALGLATVADAAMLVPDATDLITKGIKYAGKKHLQKKVAKEFERAINERIWRDGRNIEKYGYNPRRIIMGTPVGMPAPDADTFFHSGNFVSNLQPGTPVPKRGGYVRVKDGQIHPIDGGSGEPRVWWNKGDNYGNGEIILTTKSSKVDERVVDNLDKYDKYHGSYYPSYYTSGAIPLDEVDLYYRNPLTGDYDHPIQFTPNSTFFKIGNNLEQLDWLLFKQGGRLIPKHAKGNPVNTNPLPKIPINTNPIPKKEDKKKSFKIDQRIIGLRPTPGLLTFPKGNGRGLYMIKRNE